MTWNRAPGSERPALTGTAAVGATGNPPTNILNGQLTADIEALPL